MNQAAINVDEMGTMPVSRILIKYCVPAILTNVINALYNAVDRAFIGSSEGYAGIAALTVGGSAMTFMLALSNLIGIGGLAFFSLTAGRGENEKLPKIINQTFSLLVILGVIETALGLLFLRPICLRLGAGNQALPFAIKYLRIIFTASVIQSIGTGMVGFLRGSGMPRQALMCSAGGALINVVFDYLFVKVFSLGITGAAIATVIGQAFSAIWFIAIFTEKKCRITPFNPKFMLLSSDIVKTVLSMGSSIFAMQCGVFLLQVTQQNTLQHFNGVDGFSGDMLVSALGVSTAIGGVIAQVNAGYRQGIQPLFGFNYGAALYGRVRKLLWQSMLVIMATLSICIAFLFLFTKPAILLFSSSADEESISLYIVAVRMFNLCVPFIPVNSAASSYFQAIGEVKKANFVGIMRPVLIAIPCIVIVTSAMGSGMGVFYSGMVSDVLSAVFSLLFLIKADKDLRIAERKSLTK